VALVAGASAGLGGARPQVAKATGEILGPVLWNTVVGSPEVASSSLNGVDCVSATDCWAVGYTGVLGGTTAGLIENYNGTIWSLVASPTVTGSTTYLSGVTCFGADDCWAVGSSSDAEASTDLIEHYDGTAWALAASPTFGAGSAFLIGVTCASATDCWAVGDETNASSEAALVEEYSGGTWSTVTTPTIGGASESELTGVACASASECWAVGFYFTASAEYPLAEEYAGSGWSLGSPVSPPGGSDTTLSSVSCVSTTDCWATGSYWNGAGATDTLVEQYTASGWSVVSSYTPPASVYAADVNVTCVSASDCWAVGKYVDNDFHTFPLIEQYGGSSWSDAYSPSPSDDAELAGVSCVSSSDCVAVGPRGSVGQALIEQTYQPVASAYTPLNPFRICDTRSAAVTGYSTECSGLGALGSGEMTFPVAGVDVNGETVPADAQSVVVNVTAIDGNAGTFLTVFPAGSNLPSASNLNVDYATNQANLVVVALGAGGELTVYNAQGSINVAVDVEGYFSAASGGTGQAGLFHSMAPLRLCDTRSGMDTACSGTPLTAGAWQKVVVSGCPEGDPGCSGPVPSDGTAEAVALNLTAVDGSSGTYLSVVPPNGSDACPTTTPSFSNLNVGPAHNLPNRVIVPLGPDQDVCVYNSLGTINYILDINGWFGDGSESTQGALYYAIPPTRICDTRDESVVDYSTECTDETLTPDDTLTVAVAGVDGVPIGGATPPVAVIANVTAVAGTSGTLFILYPAGISQPLASDLNINASQNVANLGIVQLSASGELDLYNDLGTIDAIVDVAGWFQDPPTV
jgi:hypothetical protein